MNSVFHVNLLNKTNSPSNLAIWRWLLRLGIAGILLFVTYAGFRAMSEAFDSGGFPEALAVKVEILPVIFPMHMIAGGMALLLVPATFFLRGSQWHKWAGRITALDILVAGITAPFVAWTAPVTVISAAGFTAQAIVWAALLVAGVWYIKKGNRSAHQTCMILMASVTSGALFFRVYLALWSHFASVHYFKMFYTCNAWIAWSLPLLVTALVLRKRGLAAHRSLSL